MNTAISLILFFIFIAAIPIVIVCLSLSLGKKSKNPSKELPYECGLDPVSSPRRPFSVKFFAIAILFILFDVEIVFLYPSAIVYREAIVKGEGVIAFFEIAAFAAVLFAGLVYVWAKSAIEWEK